MPEILSQDPCQKSFSKAWMDRRYCQPENSNVLDHANSGQHKVAMSCYKCNQVKAHNEPVASYAPIASSLLNVHAAIKDRTKKKFDICYMLAKEGMSFLKYPNVFDQKFDKKLTYM